MSDILLTAIRAYRRNPKCSGPLLKIMTAKEVFTYVPADTYSPSRPLTRVSVIRTDDGVAFVPFFSNKPTALRVLERLLAKQDNQGRRLDLVELNAMDLLAYSDRHNLPVWYNPYCPAAEQKRFTVEECQGLLLEAWSNSQVKASPRLRLRLKKSPEAEAGQTLPAFSGADFAAPLTAEQIAGLFAVDVEYVERFLTVLAEKHVLDKPALWAGPASAPEATGTSATLPDEAERSEPAAAAEQPVTRQYQPLAAFHLGYQLDNARGRQFRLWHTQLLYDYCVHKPGLAVEIERGRRQAGMLRSVLQERNEEIKKLEAELERLQPMVTGQKAGEIPN